MKFAVVLASLAGYASAVLSSAGPDYQDPTAAAERAERELLALLDDEEQAANNKASKQKKRTRRTRRKRKVAFLELLGVVGQGAGATPTVPSLLLEEVPPEE